MCFLQVTSIFLHVWLFIRCIIVSSIISPSKREGERERRGAVTYQPERQIGSRDNCDFCFHLAFAISSPFFTTPRFFLLSFCEFRVRSISLHPRQAGNEARRCNWIFQSLQPLAETWFISSANGSGKLGRACKVNERTNERTNEQSNEPRTWVRGLGK